MTETCAGTFVLASGDHMPVREVAEKIRDIIDPQLEIGLGELVPAQRPLGLRGNPQALRAATGWRASTPIANGLSRTVDWYRAHLARYSQEDVE
jgi:nucleoside-diphosphate-sugar epimerase